MKDELLPVIINCRAKNPVIENWQNVELFWVDNMTIKKVSVVYF